MPRSRWAQAFARLVHETELNYGEIAAAAKITQNTVTNILHDKHVPTLDVLQKIADVLTVDITEMVATESQSRVLRAAATFGTAHEGAIIETLLQKIDALQHRVGELEKERTDK